MSRSYHTTRRSLEELEKSYFADPKKKSKAIEKTKQELAKKRIVKKYIKFERRHGGKAKTVPVDIDAIPITVADISKYVHFPAGPDDLRELLRRLPVSLSDGIAEIRLSLGKRCQKIRKDKDFLEAELSPDPFTGRLGHEIIPGIYSGHVLGQYSSSDMMIRLFAYVYSEDIAHRNIVEFYVRLRMLMTFIHELGHHFDFMSRVARGRWLADAEDKAEMYAENIEHGWKLEYLIPYVEQRYRRELEKFNAWMMEYAGVTVPLAIITGDPRETAPNGGIRTSVIFNIATAFEDFVGTVIGGKDITAGRIAYARDLHYAEEYELALAILKTILEKDPQNVDAIILKGDIFVHQENFETAIEQAELAIKLSPDNADAIEVMANACEGLERWIVLEQLAGRLMENYKGKGWYYSALKQRARARLGQMNYAGVWSDLDELGRAALPSGRRLRIPRFWAEQLVDDLSKQLEQNINLPKRELAERLFNNLKKQIQQAGTSRKIEWPYHRTD